MTEQVMVKLFIGLFVPFVAVNLMIPVVNASDIRIFEIPFVFVWIFCWFLLTSLCLAICWFGFDRPRADGGSRA